MRRAIITGSFDPVTSGHEELILRSAALFDEVFVVVLANTEKAGGTFAPEDRVRFLERTVAALPVENISVLLWSGLTSDAAAKLGAKFIVRGARNASDFDYEYNLSLIMKRFDPSLETVILPASPERAMISSTYVRDLLKYGSPLGDAVPEAIRDEMQTLYRESRG